MFAAIARFDIRFRWPIVAVWLMGVVAGASLLPGLTTVTHITAAGVILAGAFVVLGFAGGSGQNAAGGAVGPGR